MAADRARLATWLAEQGVTQVALASTGVFGKPVVTVLAEQQVTVVLANAAPVKAVPGRTTDGRDSAWLLDLRQQGLIRASFVPPAPVRALRDRTRSRPSRIEDRARHANRVQQVLEDANLTLAAVGSDVLGVSARRRLVALAAGETDPVRLADLAAPPLRRQHEALAQALTGQVQPHHRLLRRALLDHSAYLDGLIARVDAELEAACQPFLAAIERLCSSPGVTRRAAAVIVAEIGVDWAAFPSAAHRCSWAAICPGTTESGGKPRSGRTRHGNRWLRRVLLQAAWAATRRRGYLAAQFRRIARRRGEQRAIVAVAHRLLTIIYHRLRRGVLDADLGERYCDELDPERRRRDYVRQLPDLGYKVELEPASAA